LPFPITPFTSGIHTSPKKTTYCTSRNARPNPQDRKHLEILYQNNMWNTGMVSLLADEGETASGTVQYLYAPRRQCLNSYAMRASTYMPFNILPSPQSVCTLGWTTQLFESFSPNVGASPIAAFATPEQCSALSSLTSSSKEWGNSFHLRFRQHFLNAHSHLR